MKKLLFLSSFFFFIIIFGMNRVPTLKIICLNSIVQTEMHNHSVQKPTRLASLEEKLHLVPKELKQEAILTIIKNHSTLSDLLSPPKKHILACAHNSEIELIDLEPCLQFRTWLLNTLTLKQALLISATSRSQRDPIKISDKETREVFNSLPKEIVTEMRKVMNIDADSTVSTILSNPQIDDRYKAERYFQTFRYTSLVFILFAGLVDLMMRWSGAL